MKVKVIVFILFLNVVTSFHINEQRKIMGYQRFHHCTQFTSPRGFIHKVQAVQVSRTLVQFTVRPTRSGWPILCTPLCLVSVSAASLLK